MGHGVVYDVHRARLRGLSRRGARDEYETSARRRVHPSMRNRTGTDEERTLLLLLLLPLLLLRLYARNYLRLYVTVYRTIREHYTCKQSPAGQKSSTVGSSHAEVVSRDHRLFFIGQSPTVITSYRSSVAS